MADNEHSATTENAPAVANGGVSEEERAKIRAQHKEFAAGSAKFMLSRFNGEDLINNYWEHKGTRDDVNYFVGMVEGIEWPCLKAVCKVRTTRKAVADLVMDINRAKDFDDSCESITCLEKIDDHTEIRHARGVPYAVVSARDFIVISSVEDRPDEYMTIIATRSTEHPDDPKPEGFVRGEIYISGYILRSIAEDLTEVNIIAHINVNGYIPPQLLYYVGEQGPKGMIARIKQILEEGKTPEPTSYWPSFSLW